MCECVYLYAYVPVSNLTPMHMAVGAHLGSIDRVVSLYNHL